MGHLKLRRILTRLFDQYGRGRQRQPDLTDHAGVPEAEKVTAAMAKKIIDDARKHRLSVEQEKEGQDQGQGPGKNQGIK